MNSGPLYYPGTRVGREQCKRGTQEDIQNQHTRTSSSKHPAIKKGFKIKT
jgi:hypothetical protein